MSAPCKNCPNRSIGCHGKCDKYAEFKVYCDRINAKRKAERDLRDFIHTVHSARFA